MNISDALKDSVSLHQALLENDAFLKQCEGAGEIIGKALTGGKKVLVAGNGGSAADSQHFATEFVATFKRESRSGYPVLALTTDTSFITAWANDFDYDSIFARQVQAWGREGDVFIGISTSGNSKNVVEAMKQAKQSGLHTIGLLGNDGGTIKELCDSAIVVPSKVTARIQEVHIFILHAWCDMVVPQLS